MAQGNKTDDPDVTTYSYTVQFQDNDMTDTVSAEKHMTSTEAVRVLPVDGKMENFKMWSTQFLALALKKKYIDVLNGKLSVPKDDNVFAESRAERVSVGRNSY